MLFYEKRPEIERNFASSRRAAGNDGSSASEAIEAFDENVASNMFDNQVDTTAIGDFADFSRPGGVGGIENKFCAEMMSERAFGFGGAGADDASAELFGNLNRGRADAARSADDERPIPLVDRRSIGEHVHRRAAGESESGRSVEINALGKANETASGNENFFGEAAVAIDAEELAKETEGLFAAHTEFTFAAEEVGLNGDFIANTPILYVIADGEDAAGDFAAKRTWKLDGNGQSGGFGPEIDVVKAAALDLNDGIVRAGNGIGNIAQFEFSGRAVCDELEGFHSASLESSV